MRAFAAFASRSCSSSSRWCCALAIGCLLSTAPSRAQSATSFQDLLPDLASKIAGALTPGSRVNVTDAGSAPAIARDVAALLTARGFVAPAGGAPPAAAITVGCGANLRERACVADIRRGDARDVVTAVAPHDMRPPDGRALGLDAIPLFAQRAPILDVALVDDRLIVLDPSALTLYRRSTDDWQRIESRAIEPAHVWPRDVRGRLRIAGSTIEAFLPGVTCRGPLGGSSFSCVDQREPWPIAVDNAGLDGLRNAFQTPEGTPFYSATTLDPRAGARAAIVDLNHALVLMDGARSVVATVGAADDVAGVVAPCREGAHVVTSAPTAGAATDTLHLLQVADRGATAAATPIVLPGRLTALWSTPGAASAIAIVRDADGRRYEAFQIRVSCAR